MRVTVPVRIRVPVADIDGNPRPQGSAFTE